MELAMIPYYIMLLLPLLLQWAISDRGLIIHTGKSKQKVITGDISLPVFFFLLMLLLTLRDQTLGRDLGNYYIRFNQWGNYSLAQIFSSWKECVFHFYSWLFYNYISRNYQLFVSITSLITVLPIAYVYNKDRSHGYIKTSLFVNMATFFMLFSGIRQGMAMAVGALAFQSLKENKNLRFFIYCLVAVLIHHTGFMILFLFPLYKMRFHKRDLFWIVPLASVIIIFNARIFNALSLLFASLDDSYIAVAGTTEAGGSFILFLVFTVFCYWIMDEEQMDDEMYSLRNIMIFTTVIQSFAALNSWAMRMNYYSILLFPIAVGRSFDYVKPRYKQIAKIAQIIISVFFTILFLYKIYNSYRTGISALDTIPYVPFWKE